MPFCHNCGTQLSDAAKFCPSCGAAFQGSQTSQPTVQTNTGSSQAQTAQSSQSPQTPLVSPVQQNVVVMGKQKSVGTAFLLAFLFGPLGLLYASIIGGIVMFFIGLLLFFLLPVIGAIMCWVACIIWACVAADNANKKMVDKGGALINNQFQR